MIKMTKVRLHGLSTIDLPVVGARPSDRYILKTAEGLGPPEVDVSQSRTLHAGDVYQRRRPQSREVVLTVRLNPDHQMSETAADLRAELYGLLTPGYLDEVKIDILDGDDLQASTAGNVSKLEINPFSAEPEVQITIPCLQAYLHAPNILYVFPGSAADPSIMNVGTAPTGFRAEILFTAPTNWWGLFNGRGQSMTFYHAFHAGDKLTFDTNPGSRGIWLTRDGATYSILQSLASDSVWHMLYGGNNTFEATSNTGYTWGNVYYTPQYWGI